MLMPNAKCYILWVELLGLQFFGHYLAKS